MERYLITNGSDDDDDGDDATHSWFSRSGSVSLEQNSVSFERNCSKLEIVALQLNDLVLKVLQLVPR